MLRAVPPALWPEGHPIPQAAMVATSAGGTFNLANETLSTIGGGQFQYRERFGECRRRRQCQYFEWRQQHRRRGALNIASGFASMVAGGSGNVAAGHYSFAAGHNARSMNSGCFTWADSSSPNTFVCAGTDAFVARAAGGVYFRTNAAATTGVALFGGAGSWSMASDRALKEHIVAVDPSDVLERLLRMPVATWNYRAKDASIRHMGPMAQDVHAAFSLGESDKRISSVDANGIAFAAIQGLNAKLEATVAEQARRTLDCALSWSSCARSKRKLRPSGQRNLAIPLPLDSGPFCGGCRSRRGQVHRALPLR